MTITAKNIIALATLKPKSIIKTSLETYKLIGDSLTYEEITGVFKEYKPLDNGNSKLAKGIFSFSLLPVVTCNRQCNGCYDIRSLRYPSVRLKRTVNTILASSKHAERLFKEIKTQIIRSRTVTAVRIHVGGDFFSQAYTNQWTRLSRELQSIKPSVNVYTYTKTAYTLDLQFAGINVVRSILSDGSYNFGPFLKMRVKAKKAGGVLCPATTMKNVPNGFCGSKCKACQNTPNVFFVIH